MWRPAGSSLPLYIQLRILAVEIGVEIWEWTSTLAVEDKLAVKHAVTLDEVDDCFFGNYSRAFRRGRSGSYAMYGRTDAGRYLLVLFYLRDYTAHVATARDMDDAERRWYREQTRT